jgi:hypothetical protein
MAQLPLITSNLVDLASHWKSLIDPVLRSPMLGVSIIKNVQLQVGVNVINHGLGQIQQGWFLTDQQAVGTVYRSQPFNSLTLTLTSSAAMTVNIAVF